MSMAFPELGWDKVLLYQIVNFTAVASIPITLVTAFPEWAVWRKKEEKAILAEEKLARALGARPGGETKMGDDSNPLNVGPEGRFRQPRMSLTTLPRPRPRQIRKSHGASRVEAFLERDNPYALG